MRQRTQRPSRGFTLTELVVILVILGVISVFAASRLTGSFAPTRGFHDRVLAQAQYGRKTAIAQRRAVFVQVDAAAGSVTLCYSAGAPCASPVSSPTGQSPFTVSAPSGASIAPSITFQFDALGRFLTSAGADPGANQTITVTGEGSYSFVVERDTGYVHP